MFLRAISSLFFLTLIILLVPLTFDIGGRDAGLGFSLSVASFYFFLSLLRISTPESSTVRRTLINILRSLQWLIIPSLCIWALGRFSVDANNSGRWVERTFRNKKGFLDAHSSLSDAIFGPEGLIENVTLLEGFCSLLVIQAVGQFSRWLVNRSEWSDAWLLTLLVSAAGVVSSSVYFLWRVLQFPDISNIDSTLIGIAIASAIFLCAYGVVSGRGTAMESSLLFAYIVLCIYQIFTDYKPNVPVDAGTASSAPDFPPFPPIIMSSYTALMHALSQLPEALVTALDFTVAAFRAVTPSVLISLGYRLFVFYASTRIIPAVNESGVRGLSMEPSLDDNDAGNRFLAFLSWFSPSILIAVYTSLLMQHFATTIGGYSPGLTESISAWWSGNGQPGVNGNAWKWVNLVITMGLYAVELWLGKEEDIDGGHWKVD
ncbi:hypothetical protein LTS17_004505 [Exophiala oligosperma]